MAEIWDVIVVGAGAAGMLAAIEAGRRGRRVLVIDHAAQPGEKIRISGGGRCNFTNTGIGVENYLGRNPRFALSALKRFTQWDVVARIDQAGIAWHEKTLGQLFCDGSAKQVVAWLVDEMRAAGVVLWLSTEPGEVSRAGAGFRIATPRGVQETRSLILATGGKSIPKMGASPWGYRVAESLGLQVTETRPGLVPLTFAEQELAWIKPLAGVALPVRLRSDSGGVAGGRGQFDEAMLFTHRGLSGPATLQVSSYWREGERISVDLLPAKAQAGHGWLREAKKRAGRGSLTAALAQVMPERLAKHLGQAETGPLAEMSDARLEAIAAGLHDWQLTPVGSEGYRTAEVTLGGVDTDGLDAKTLQAKAVPGLYVVGELVDITGWLGGYNFQWAWSSGWAAGQVA
ncbi:NAD(P)/FAD-dependent oxidoreductase [Xinfangfangia sp. D13-10-4-6]|uniref:NAD(P)/FAD-dependent oxidoreductase n=1 Tax=Pseudogemmobacter hezensis TaxID=2737662 RepID=UPI001552BD93|nr:aminoacetone oxidase family FAD-binding enzyme [Pseudogemmobacter hezensis]NPD17321.1 NAD(P)/FAD-dependent oxidoreductase [Pseudogemmobacter hezensis]